MHFDFLYFLTGHNVSSRLVGLDSLFDMNINCPKKCNSTKPVVEINKTQLLIITPVVIINVRWWKLTNENIILMFRIDPTRHYSNAKLIREWVIE